MQTLSRCFISGVSSGVNARGSASGNSSVCSGPETPDVDVEAAHSARLLVHFSSPIHDKHEYLVLLIGNLVLPVCLIVERRYW